MMTAETQLAQLSELFFGTTASLKKVNEPENDSTKTSATATKQQKDMLACFEIDIQQSSVTLNNSRQRLTKEECQLVSNALSYSSPNLKYLTLQDVDLDEEGLQALHQIVRSNHSLQFLNLWGCTNILPTTAFDNLMTSIRQSHNITELGLMECQLEPSGWLSVANLLSHNECQLASLYLQGSNLGPKGCEAIAKELATNATLTRLSLPGTIGTNGQMAMAKAMTLNATLEELHLNDNQLSLDSCRVLSNAISKNTALTSLGLDNTQIDSQGWKLLVDSLSTNGSLQSLLLNADERTHGEWVALSQMLAVNKSLVSVDLCSTSCLVKKKGQPTAAMLDSHDIRTLANGLATNYTLEQIRDPWWPCSRAPEEWKEVEFYLEMNRLGRRELLSGPKQPEEWINTLAKCSDSLPTLFYLLSENPELCAI